VSAGRCLICNKRLLHLLGLRVAGDDDANGLLACGGARPLLREPADLEVIGVAAPAWVGSLRELCFLPKAFFMPFSILPFEDIGWISGRVDNLRESPV
jgi:hypothetical protein